MATIFIADAVYDGMLDAIANNADTVRACAMGADANNITNVVNNTLGSAAITSGDFTKGDRAISGRKIQFDGKAITISGNGNGTVDTICFTAAGTTLYAVSLTSTGIAVVDGSSTLTVNAYDLLGTPDAVAV